MKTREEQIRKTFDYASVEFHYPDDLCELETVLETLKDNKVVNTENDADIGESYVLDRLIVMDDVSGLTDKSMEFSSFLTVSRKYRYSCIYNFHIIFPHISTWQMILSQTKIFNIFPSAIQLKNMSRILRNNCDREMIKYMPKRELRINCLYFEIANQKNYPCLTIDCGNIGPSKYRTQADNNLTQTCYYIQKRG